MIHRVQHCNVNCSSLERSVTFYRDELGLNPLVRSNPRPQDGVGFGIEGPAQWDAWMMSDGRANPVIDLLEWKLPAPTRRPQTAQDLGMTSIQLEHSGISVPTEMRDPDGTPIELVPGDATRISGVKINVRDADRSRDWYRSVLGLHQFGDKIFVVEDDFAINLQPVQSPSSASVRVTDLGIFRMAFLVDNAFEAVNQVRRRGVECPDPVWLDMGPTIPIDGIWATLFNDPDDTCLEFIQAPNET